MLNSMFKDLLLGLNHKVRTNKREKQVNFALFLLVIFKLKSSLSAGYLMVLVMEYQILNSGIIPSYYDYL